MWYIYTMEYYSDIKKWNNAICSNMDGPRDYYTKWSQTEKDKYYMRSLICGTKKKTVQMNLFMKQKQTHRHRKQTYGYQRGRGGGKN